MYTKLQALKLLNTQRKIYAVYRNMNHAVLWVILTHVRILSLITLRHRMHEMKMWKGR